MLLSDELPYKDFFLTKVLKPSLSYCFKKMDADNNRLSIVSKTNDSGDVIADYVSSLYPTKTLGRFNSKIKDIELRMEETLRDVVVTTDKSFAGITNIPHLEVIINVTPITSEAHLLQIAGRMRKEDGKMRIFVQLVDMSFKKARSMIQRERAIILPVSIDETKFVVGKTVRSYEEE